MYQELHTTLSTYAGALSNYPSSGEIGEADFALYFLMIELLIFYVSFALAGGLISWKKIFLPVCNRLAAEGKEDHPYLSSPFISAVVWIMLSTVVIPFMAWSLIDESEREKFIDYVYDGATE